MPGSRTIRDLLITSGSRSLQRLQRTYRRLRQRKATANEFNTREEEETLENDVMDAEGSLHQEPREACITEDTKSIDFGMVREHEAEPCEKWHWMLCLVACGYSCLGITWHITIDDSKMFLVKRWQRSWMQKWKEKTKFIL